MDFAAIALNCHTLYVLQDNLLLSFAMTEDGNKVEIPHLFLSGETNCALRDGQLEYVTLLHTYAVRGNNRDKREERHELRRLKWCQHELWQG